MISLSNRSHAKEALVIAMFAASFYAVLLSAKRRKQGLVEMTSNQASDLPAANGFVSTRMVQHTSLLGNDPLTIDYYQLQVPENRHANRSRQISVGYSVVHQSRGSNNGTVTEKKKNAAVFLVAGGPGSSINTKMDSKNEHPRERVIRKLRLLRQIGDVYIVDLRGTYLSTPHVYCPGLEGRRYRNRAVRTEEESLHLETLSAAKCRQYLLDEGFDIRGYNVLEAAQDIVDVATAHNFSKIHVAGTSFGAFLSLTLARYHSDVVDRVFATGIEGYDLTIDDEELVGQALEKIAEQARGVWDHRHGFETPLKAHISLIERAEHEEQVCDKKVSRLLRWHCRKYSIDMTAFEYKSRVKNSGSLYRLNLREHMADWPKTIDQYLSGDKTLFRRGYAEFYNKGKAAATEGLFDCTSWVSRQRGQYLRDQSQHPYLLSEYASASANCAGWQLEPLPESFRLPKKPIDTPVLLLQGTIDTATPVNNARDTSKQFPNGHYIEVENASHDVFLEVLEYHPDFAHVILDFFENGVLPAMNHTSIPPIEFHNCTS